MTILMYIFTFIRLVCYDKLGSWNKEIPFLELLLSWQPIERVCRDEAEYWWNCCPFQLWSLHGYNHFREEELPKIFYTLSIVETDCDDNSYQEHDPSWFKTVFKGLKYLQWGGSVEDHGKGWWGEPAEKRGFGEVNDKEGQSIFSRYQ